MESPSFYNVQPVQAPGQLPKSEEAALLIAEQNNLNPRLYRAIERILVGDIDGSIAFLQREKQVRGMR